jgi:hypothetical protein
MVLLILIDVVFNPSNPVATIRNMTGLGNKEIIKGMIDKVNMLVDGGELIQVHLQMIYLY